MNSGRALVGEEKGEGVSSPTSRGTEVSLNVSDGRAPPTDEVFHIDPDKISEESARVRLVEYIEVPKFLLRGPDRDFPQNLEETAIPLGDGSFGAETGIRWPHRLIILNFIFLELIFLKALRILYQIYVMHRNE